MNDAQKEIEARLIRIETKLSVLMNVLGFDTHGHPIGKGAAVDRFEEQQPLSNAPRDPFAGTGRPSTFLPYRN